MDTTTLPAFLLDALLIAHFERKRKFDSIREICSIEYLRADFSDRLNAAGRVKVTPQLLMEEEGRVFALGDISNEAPVDRLTIEEYRPSPHVSVRLQCESGQTRDE
ncbi:hypothetical protein [Methylocapsa sp. S129]|uniref:hypothetical protein n=1 Tax=Methylocapsa sp. S129 TaxID=1641869 RepID=UPI001AEF2822|nr:hypothetical protein [Methylocapsa sp. S129]